MAMNFPDSPSVDDTYTVGDRTWIWNGTTWDSYSLDSFLDSGTAGQVAISAGTAGALWEDAEATLAAGAAGQLVVSAGTAGVSYVPTGVEGYTALAAGTAGITYQPVSHNYIINGAFDVAQRGTSFTNVTFTYHLDRWEAGRGGFDTGLDISRVSATGLNDIRYAMRVQRASGNTSTQNIRNAYILETADSIPLAGKAVTLSFYARKGADWSATTLDVALISGTGTDQGDIAVSDVFATGPATVVTASPLLTTSWQRFTLTGTVSTSATQLAIRIRNNNTGTAGASDYYEITGVQLEAGSVATPFKRHAPSLQGELAACQRYFERQTIPNFNRLTVGQAVSTTVVHAVLDYSEKRSTPSISSTGTYLVTNAAGSTLTGTSILFDNIRTTQSRLGIGVAIGLVAGNASIVNGGSTAFTIDISSEL